MRYLSFLFLLLSVATSGYAQTTKRNNLFAGKWEITIADSPEVKFVTELVRKKGKLTGELADPADPSKPKLPITRVEEKGNSVSIYYQAPERKELAIDLTTVDKDNLKGTMYTYDATAKRIK